MINRREIINLIAKEYGILQGTTESEYNYMSRVIYSLLGRMGYASLWDTQEDLLPASITHFKNRINSVLNSYLEIFPELNRYYKAGKNQSNGSSSKKICDEIYDIYLYTGNIYHTPYKVLPCIETAAHVNCCWFTRGSTLETKQFISGLGTYCVNEKEFNRVIDINDMFQLQKNSLKTYWVNQTQKISWKKYQYKNDLEYMRMKGSFRKGYWTDEIDNTGRVSLLRTNGNDIKIYYFYKVLDGEIYTSQLPTWEVENGNYRNLSNACLAVYDALPKTRYHIDGNIVKITINYLYPPAELNLIKLYSWPESFINLPHDFRRIMDKNIFYLMKQILEEKGYMFEEE